MLRPVHRSAVAVAVAGSGGLELVLPYSEMENLSTQICGAGMNILRRIRRIPGTVAARARMRRKVRQADSLRLNIGAGGTEYPGWISLERRVLDITSRSQWNSLLGKRRVENILAEHVFEHLHYQDAIRAFKYIAECMAPGGVFRFAVPDGNHPSAYVRELTGPGGKEQGAEDHKYFYTIGDIPEIERLTGLHAEPLEYFGADGMFVSGPIDFARGYISRCSANYKGRFTESGEEMRRMMETVPEHLREQFHRKGISYTSLLVDWVK